MNTPLARKSRSNSWFTRASALVMVSLVVTCSGATLDVATASATTPKSVTLRAVAHPAVTADANHESIAAAAPPRAVLTVPKTTTVGVLISVKTKGSKVPGHVRSVTIDYGDKSAKWHGKAMPLTKSHRYAKAGRYTITLTVVDRHNRVARVAHKITVRARVVHTGPATNNPTGGKLPTKSFEPPPALAGTDLPASVTLMDDTVAPGDQENVGSCVAWAIAHSLVGWYANKQNIASGLFAPMFTYALTNGGKDDGSYPTDALTSARDTGVDTESDYGTNHSDYDWWDTPTNPNIANAGHYKISGFTNLFMHSTAGATDDDIEQIKAHLAGGQPVAVGFEVHVGLQEFTGGRVYTDTSTTLVGGHEVLAIGYDSTGLLIENSWGDWADGGFARLAWSVVSNDFYEADVISGLVPVQSQSDTTAPTATAPTQTMAPSTTMNQYGAPVTISWSGSDNSGTVASYDLWAATDGGAWTQQTLSSVNATSITYGLKAGSRYRFAVQARDAAGNLSSWEYGNAFTVQDFAETSSAIKWSTGWNYQPWAQADGGQIASSATTGAWASFTDTGRNFAWVTDRATNRGQAYVWIDGTFVGTPDLYSSSTVAKSIAAVYNSTTSGQHTITIEVVGTSGRPDVDVDSFIVLS